MAFKRMPFLWLLIYDEAVLFFIGNVSFQLNRK